MYQRMDEVESTAVMENAPKCQIWSNMICVAVKSMTNAVKFTHRVIGKMLRSASVARTIVSKIRSGQADITVAADTDHTGYIWILKCVKMLLTFSMIKESDQYVCY